MGVVNSVSLCRGGSRLRAYDFVVVVVFVFL